MSRALVGRTLTIDVDTLYETAAQLVSDDGENPEYDRGVQELLCDLLGLSIQEGGREFIADSLAVAKARLMRLRANPCD